MYVIVKETMVVSRYHVVRADKKSAVDKVKECAKESEYLESCDELDWQGKISYEVEELPENWEKDRRLSTTIKHIEARLSEEPAESPLTKRPRKRKMKKAPPKFTMAQVWSKIK